MIYRVLKVKTTLEIGALVVVDGHNWTVDRRLRNGAYLVKREA